MINDYSVCWPKTNSWKKGPGSAMFTPVLPRKLLLGTHVTLALTGDSSGKGSIPNKFSSFSEGHRSNTNIVHCNLHQVCGLAP